MDAHLRIDAGVKRGKRQKSTRPAIPKPAYDAGLWHVPAHVNPDEVIARYMSEATTAQIAQSYGCTRKALTRWIRAQRPDEWKAAQALRALCTKEDAETGLSVAPDALSLARARELLKSAHFDLQALDEDYRPRSDVHIEITGDLGERLRRSRERVIEGQATNLGASLGASQTLIDNATNAINEIADDSSPYTGTASRD